MRPSPSIVPGIDRDVCLVLDDFGPIGRAWSEINVEDTDFETVITNLLDGRFSNPIRVVAFNTAEGWSRDISEVVALELFWPRDRLFRISKAANSLQLKKI